ncbi:lasso peptide biosynthesis B2 protein [Acaryochloris sp. IP29b_bin.148]|uniref:lasso peptide biosynthesis B2 protein n=1 Tax=Acaryochloris sp. IP29b_bin.148 TaxID=2969218 RepID=UPI00262B1813|nr:lasso peptide biosynthesis B2 protein [Acaryochloris sp. IP29b_bin.148]
MLPVLKFFRLRRRDRALLSKTFILLTAIRFGLWLLPFQTLRKLLDNISHPRQPQDAPPPPRSVNRMTWMVNTGSRYMPGHVKCLARALATEVLLRRHHHNPQLRIGVTKTSSGQLEAHAWVELEGQVVIGQVDDLARFTPMPALR